jgi:hypothetical protein
MLVLLIKFKAVCIAPIVVALILKLVGAEISNLWSIGFNQTKYLSRIWSIMLPISY